jgi:hypothetical protein
MKFKFSGNLLRFSNFLDEIEVVAQTIEQGINELVANLPQLKPVLLDGQGRPRAVHRFFRNGELVSRDGLKQHGSTADEISILTAIAGG